MLLAWKWFPQCIKLKKKPGENFVRFSDMCAFHNMNTQTNRFKGRRIWWLFLLFLNTIFWEGNPHSYSVWVDILLPAWCSLITIWYLTEWLSWLPDEIRYAPFFQSYFIWWFKDLSLSYCPFSSKKKNLFLFFLVSALVDLLVLYFDYKLQ